MYQILCFGRKATKPFCDYEQARQWVRKQLRKMTYLRHAGQPTATMREYGYRIIKVG